MVRYLFVFLPSLLVLSAFAQAPPCNLRLSGRVFEVGDGSPLAFAQVTCLELERGVLSDSSGFYSFEGLCPGEYTFLCSHVGCKPMQVILSIQSNTFYDFGHIHLLQQLFEVSIVSERPGYKAIQGSERLTEKDLQLSQGKSLAESMLAMNGVAVLRNGSTIGKPLVRGLHSNRVLIMNNGVRQEGQQWGNEHAPEIDPFIATRIVLVKGASAVRFGSDAIAGVVLVEPAAIRSAPGVSGRFNGVGTTNGRGGVGSAILEGRPQKFPSWSWRAQGTFKRGGNTNTPDYYLKNTGMRELNYSGTMGYQHGRIKGEVYYSRFRSEVGIFSGAHIGNLTDLQLALDSRVPAETAGFSYAIRRPSQKIDHELTKVALDIRLKQNSKLKWIYARQYNNRSEFDKHAPLNDSLAGLNKPALQFELTTHSLEVLYESKWGGSITNTLGVQGLLQSNTYEGRFFIPNFRKNGLGVFAIERLRRAGSKHEWELGVRYDLVNQQVFIRQANEILSPQYHYKNMSANAGMVYYRNDNETYRMSLASAWRPPAINELYSNGLHHGVAAIEMGDPNLRVERSFGLELSGEYRNESIKMEAQPFFQYINHFVLLRPADEPVLTIRGAFPAFDFVQTNALLTGYDTRITFDFLRHFEIGARTSLLRAYDSQSGKHLVQMPSDFYELSVNAHTDRWKGLHNAFVTIGAQYRNKQWRVPATEDFTGSPGAYLLCSAQFGFSVPVHQQFIVVSMAVDNFMDVAYRDYLNRFRYYSDEMGRNFTMRLTIPFDFQKNTKVINTNTIN